jgi:WD40 repeat protein
LAALTKAAAMQPSPPPSNELVALRSEVIASMVLPDIHPTERKDHSLRWEKLSLAPDFERYAICDGTGVVSIRRLFDDTEMARLPGGGTNATGVWGFSPDGRFLPVTYADGRWRVWDWAKSAVAAEDRAFLGAGFTPDSRMIGVSDSTNILLYDLTSGASLKRISLHGLASLRAPGWFRFDPSGRMVALFTTQVNSSVTILDAQTGQTLRTLSHASHVWSIAWHPDGRHLAASSDDGTIHVWDATTGERLRSWHTTTCISLGFDHRGDLLASSGWDGWTRLWDFACGREVSGIRKSGHILHFSRDDRMLATGGWDGTMLDFFEVSRGEGLRSLYEEPIPGPEGAGWPVLDASGELLAARTREGIELWEVATEAHIGVLPLKPEMGLIGFDATTQNLILTGPQGLFRCPLIRLGHDRQCRLGKPILVNTECADPVAGRMGWISADGRLCAIVGNNRCQLFRTDTSEKLAETGVQPGMRFSALSADGALFASGAWHAPGVNVWDAKTGALLKRLPTDENLSTATANVVFSPETRFLVTSTRDWYSFWETGSWSLKRRIPQAPGNDFLGMMAFSKDGRVFAGTHSQNKARLYDAGTGEVLADLEAPNTRMITGLTFNLDGSRLFACESANALRVWDLRQIHRQLADLRLDWNQAPRPGAEPGPHAPAGQAAVRTDLSRATSPH